MSLTYVKLQDLYFLKMQLFDKIIARCVFERVIDLCENSYHRHLKLQGLHS